MLGAKLKELRRRKGLYQRHLADVMEVDTAFISKIEKEEKRLPLDHISNLAKLLQADCAELLSLWLADKLKEATMDQSTALRAAKQLNKILSNPEKV